MCVALLWGAKTRRALRISFQYRAKHAGRRFVCLSFSYSLSFYFVSRRFNIVAVRVVRVVVNVRVVLDVRVVVVVVAAACGAVQLDYFKGKEGGLNMRAWLAPGTSISLSHI